MTTEQIQKFFSGIKADSVVCVSFKTRSQVVGIFVRTTDFDDLKSKNFWRIVPEANFEQWQQSKDYNLWRMFNGAEFTKLSIK